MVINRPCRSPQLRLDGQAGGGRRSATVDHHEHSHRTGPPPSTRTGGGVRACATDCSAGPGFACPSCSWARCRSATSTRPGRVINQYAEAGGNVIDTADAYGGPARTSSARCWPDDGTASCWPRSTSLSRERVRRQRDRQPPQEPHPRAGIGACADCAPTTSTSTGCKLRPAHSDRGDPTRTRRRRPRRQAPVRRDLGRAGLGRVDGRTPWPSGADWTAVRRPAGSRTTCCSATSSGSCCRWPSRSG